MFLSRKVPFIHKLLPVAALVIFVFYSPASLFALDSVWLNLSKSKPKVSASSQNASANFSISPEQRLILCNLAIPGFQIPSTSHLAVYDNQGRRLSVSIERSSLVFASDKIISLNLAFITTDRRPNPGPWRLLWSQDLPLADDNAEYDLFSFSPQNSEQIFYAIATTLSHPSEPASTIVVEIKEKSYWKPFWYLFPLLLIFLLSRLNKYFTDSKT